MTEATSTVTGWLVRAGEFTATQVHLSPTLDALRATIGGGWLEHIQPAYAMYDVTPERVGVVVPQGQSPLWHAYFDEEGKLKGLRLNDFATFMAWALGWNVREDYLCGDVLFLGNEDGEESDLPAWVATVLNDEVTTPDNVELEVCTDCALGIANGPETPEQWTKRARAVMRWRHHVLSVVADDEPEFATRTCECCSDSLAGYRHHVHGHYAR